VKIFHFILLFFFFFSYSTSSYPTQINLTYARSLFCALSLALSLFRSLSALIYIFCAHCEIWVELSFFQFWAPRQLPRLSNQLTSRRTDELVKPTSVTVKHSPLFTHHSPLSSLLYRSPFSLLIVSVIHNDCAFIVYLGSGHGSGIWFRVAWGGWLGQVAEYPNAKRGQTHTGASDGLCEKSELCQNDTSGGQWVIRIISTQF